ncbi:MAG: hypothetical protein JW709_02280 [Sedimentisphaerales bacterium]|nr:hypothetical protein [Sedimentisphaerales bacterium]
MPGQISHRDGPTPIVDAEGKLAYQQLVPEMTTEPDYEAVLQAVRKLI